jgi:glycine reductase complex component B subunit alpha and beta
VKLDLHHHPIRDLVWGDVTRLDGGVLTVNRTELVARLLEDRRLASIDFEMARGGESCRIAPVFDILEPRCKIHAEASDFPGVVGPLASAGSGATAVLRGLALTIVNPDPATAIPVLDLRPPMLPDGKTPIGCRYHELLHLVMVPKLAQVLDENDGWNALRVAGLRAGVYLARAARELTPGAKETFELGPVTSPLPRIAYVYQMHSQQHPTSPGEPLLYGDNARHLLPTLLHPNEVLDGAVLPGYNSLGIETYMVQNHAIIRELYERHGKDVDFAGVVATVAHQTVRERERSVVMTSNLVRHILKADGVLLSKSGGGAPHVDMAEVARRCEQLGVRTTLLAWEVSEGGGSEGAALFNHPEVDAVVNYGPNGHAFALPAVDRVITSSESRHAARFAGSIQANANRLSGVMDQLGSGVLTAVRY